MTLSRDTFGHDEEIGRLFEEYDRLVRWEEHNSRLDATDPVVERAAARGRIVAFIANTATLQQDAHTSMNAEPEPQDVEEARSQHAAWSATLMARRQNAWTPPEDIDEAKAKEAEAWSAIVASIRADERKRWAEREQQLVEALTAAVAWIADECSPDAVFISEGHNWNMDGDDRTRGRAILDAARAVLNQERPA